MSLTVPAEHQSVIFDLSKLINWVNIIILRYISPFERAFHNVFFKKEQILVSLLLGSQCQLPFPRTRMNQSHEWVQSLTKATSFTLPHIFS